MGNRHRFIFWCAVACWVAAWLPPTAAADDATKELGRLIGDAACTRDAQCHTLAIGVSACGGPASYLAWSSLRSDAAALREAAARDAARQGRRLPYGRDPSTCRVLPDPGAVCARPGPAAGTTPSTGRCRLRQNRSTDVAPTQ